MSRLVFEHFSSKCKKNEQSNKWTCQPNLCPRTKVTANTTAPLFPSLPHVLCALHFLYEELKLDKAHFDDLQYLAGFLTRLAADLNLHRFVAYYANDFPSICPDQVRDARTNQISSREGERILANATGNSSMTAAVILNANSPPDIFLHLEKILLLPVGTCNVIKCCNLEFLYSIISSVNY